MDMDKVKVLTEDRKNQIKLGEEQGLDYHRGLIEGELNCFKNVMSALDGESKAIVKEMMMEAATANLSIEFGKMAVSEVEATAMDMLDGLKKNKED